MPLTEGLAALVLVLAYYIYVWQRVGRAHRKPNPELRTEPPDASPALCRWVLLMGHDYLYRAFAASALSCAVKGRLSVAKGDWTEFTLHRTPLGSGPDPEQDRLSRDEAMLMELLFETDDSIAFGLGIRGSRSKLIRRYRRRFKRLYRKRYFTWNLLRLIPGLVFTLIGIVMLTWVPIGGERGFKLAGAAVLTLGLCWVVLLLYLRMRRFLHNDREPRWTRVFMACGLVYFALCSLFGFVPLSRSLPLPNVAVIMGMVAINLVFILLLPSYTAEGSALVDRILGFRRYLCMDEQGEDAGLYERYLPYAVALEAGREWSRRFAPVFARLREKREEWRPAWYAGLDRHFEDGEMLGDEFKLNLIWHDLAFSYSTTVFINRATLNRVFSSKYRSRELD